MIIIYLLQLVPYEAATRWFSYNTEDRPTLIGEGGDGVGQNAIDIEIDEIRLLSLSTNSMPNPLPNDGK